MVKHTDIVSILRVQDLFEKVAQYNIEQKLD